MTNFLKNFSDGFSKNPTMGFMLLAIGACYYLYNDLSNFISEQQHILTTQVETQTKTVEILNNISQRLSEIEIKIYNEK